MGHHWWIGDLDDVAIWDRALTETEVKVIAQPVCQPSISISKNTGDTICVNTPVIFTATVINSTATLNYQWKLNNTIVGSNSSTYSNSTLSNGDIISCVLLNPAGCPLDTSNAIHMTVNAIQPLSVIISSDDADNIICAGSSVTFTATPTNGGSSPSFQWKVNSTDVGTNSSTYTTTSLTDQAIITCIVTSGIGSCVTGNPAVSNSIQMTVNANQPLGISISSDDADNIICAGSSVTFTATPTNQGATPVYSWKLNGNSVGPNNPLYINNAPANGDIVQCIITSNATCITSSPAISNSIIIRIPEPVILGRDTSICVSEDINLNVADTFLSYLWNTGEISKSIKVLKSGKYWVNVQDIYGCISSDTINVLERSCGFFIPTAFSPNGDGKNDLFKPILSGTILAYKFAVYNRWGEKVYETPNLTDGWNGFSGPELLSTNTFVWFCEYQLAGQPPVLKKGTVLLIR